MFFLKKVIILCVFSGWVSGQVIEMDDSFPEMKQNYAWLMEFYAPWCGHCKHLEPVYHQVSLELRSTKVKVARVDVTKHPSMAGLYEIRGFPTIKFIQKDIVIEFKGERNKLALVQFAKKAMSPTVTSITSEQEFHHLKENLSQDVFFVLISYSDFEPKYILDQFINASRQHIMSNHFFSSSFQFLPHDIQVKSIPTIVAVKQDAFKEIPENELEEGVKKWVEAERWGWVAKIDSMSINEVNSLGKVLVILVHELFDQYSQILWTVAKKSTHLADSHQFVHLTDLEVGNTMIMDYQTGPFFIIFFSSNHQFCLPTSPISTTHDLEKFIEEVQQGKIQIHGGRGGMARIKRMLYSLKNIFQNMWEDSALLTIVVVGVPCLIISMICYALFCLEISDEFISEHEINEGFETDEEVEEERKKKQ